MTPTVYHTFRNFVKGLSGFHLNPIDVRKVMNIDYRKRLFCIFDKEYKYTLEIKYSNPRSELRVSSVLTTGGQIGTGIYKEYVESSIMTLRYKTEREVKNEIREIKMKQNLITEFDNEQNLKLQEFIEKKLLDAK